MDVGWYYRLILLALFVLFSAFFSGSEVAIFSIDKKKVKDLNFSASLSGRYIINLLDYPRRLLVTILIGNTIFNVAASILAVTLALDFAADWQVSTDLMLLVQIVLLTIIILIFGEITPKVFASKHPVIFAKIIAIPLYWVSVLIFPVSKIITDVFKLAFSKVKINRAKNAILHSEIAELANIGIERGTIEEDEHELIHGLVSFKTVTTREVMTPRVDITAIPVETEFYELMNIITESGHSRIPLYEDSLDNIIGVIYAKDLLPHLGSKDSQDDFSLRKIARKVLFVPETKLISDLMHEFQEKNMHLGIVVDEYGGTAGLISLEDILEEIVGEIRDEYDNEELEITRISEKKFILLGKVPIDEMNELLEYDFSSENDDYDTVGGFILNLAGSIPEEGNVFEYENFRFTINEVESQRINKVQLEIIEKSEEE
ncbi:MAG: HlyC/CorC family transporter [Ignavibacteriae bacterium]|nr:HlyC/CorC family transporter [Ignavibacteriota bacterium]NOH00327.1 HlyC/CorC family transporter [Ignavibacteriota bacterium]